MDVSFIIPAYNVSKTIERAVKSILEQEETKLDYEVIVVNDGSTDNTEEAIKNYENRIKCYKKENGGLSDARNFGVSKARGRYVIFVDGDDYVSKTLLRDIEEYIKKDVDLIKWNPIIVNEAGNKIKNIKINEYKEATGEEGFNILFRTDPLLVCAWNYAIKKDKVLGFPKGMYHEDFATTPLVILNAESMIITNKSEYYYVQTKSSIMRGNDITKQRKRIEDILYHFDNIIDITSKMNISKITKENVGIFATNSLLVIVPDLEGDNKEYFITELKKRRIAQYIKARNLKQLIKKILISIKY